MYLSSDASLQSIPWMPGRIIPIPVAPSRMTCLIPIPPPPVYQNQTCPPIPIVQATAEAPPPKRERAVDIPALGRQTQHIRARKSERRNQLRTRTGEEKGRGREGGGDIDVSERDMKCRRRISTKARDIDRERQDHVMAALIITTTNLQIISVVQPLRQCGTSTGTRKQGNVNIGTTGVRGGGRRHLTVGGETDLWLRRKS